MIFLAAFLSACSSVPKPPSNADWKAVCGERNLPGCYHYGVEQIRLNELKTAEQAFIMTCGRGHGDACNNLGALRLRDKKNTQAKRLFEQACELKSGGGCSNLACMLGEGPCMGGELQINAAVVEKLQLACELRFAPGCFNLGQVNIRIGKPKEAMKALEQACVLKEPDGCYQLGAIQMETYNNMQAARPAFERACELGHNVACLATNSLFNGEGGAGDLYE